MDLLDKEILNSNEFAWLCCFFNGSKNYSQISYETFKINLISFARKVMKNYIKDTIYSADSCNCFCFGKNNSLGSFIPTFNIIFLNEEVIEKMYKKRDLSNLTVLFHELNHFKIKYDIKLGHFDESLIRVIKEELISKSPLYPSFIKTKKEQSTYYEDNYTFYSEEKLVEIYSLENLLLFMKKANINISQYQKQQINNLIRKATYQYNNYFRDVHSNINFNSYVIDFEEAFDILIKDNYKWLDDYPQLQIEYYLNNDGIVVKRSIDELRELLNMETNQNKIEYIESLLNGNKKKNNYTNAKKSILNKKIFFNDLNKSNKL